MEWIVSESEVRQILIESLVIENANLECKRVIRPLKARWAPIEEWIRNTTDIEPHILLMMILGYEYCFMIPRKIKMVGFNCGRKGHLKSIGKVLLETIFILEVIQTEGPRTGGTGTSTNTDKNIIKKKSVIIE